MNVVETLSKTASGLALPRGGRRFPRVVYLTQHLNRSYAIFKIPNRCVQYTPQQHWFAYLLLRFYILLDVLLQLQICL